MDKSMIAYCGTYCDACEWIVKMGCKGCKTSAGNTFWGECDKAGCCIEKGLEHRGECPDMPCIEIKVMFGDPDMVIRGSDFVICRTGKTEITSMRSLEIWRRKRQKI